MGCRACAAASAAYQKKKATEFRKTRNIVAPTPVAPVSKAVAPVPVVAKAAPVPVTPKAAPVAVSKVVVPAPVIVVAKPAPKPIVKPKLIRVKPSPQAIELAKQASKRRKLLEDYKKNKIAHKK
ncbi:MAG: hypothetical protein WD512_14935 [Candidatus Paceibacterota bacterium]